MTQSQQWLMEIGQWTVLIGMIAAMAGLVIFTVWVWNKAICRALDTHYLSGRLQEFVRWERDKDLQG